MKIALVGGTGDIGNGFALRWAAKHEIILGSRRIEKAQEHVNILKERLQGKGALANIKPAENAQAIEAGEIVVLCVPYETLPSVTSALNDSYSDQIVVSPVVPMCCSKYFEFVPPTEGCAAVMVRDCLPKTARVVSAFHTVSAAALQDRDKVLAGDVAVCGDEKEAKEVVCELAIEIKNLRPLDAGPLVVSRQVEVLTPMLLNIARFNKMRDLGIQFVRACSG